MNESKNILPYIYIYIYIYIQEGKEEYKRSQKKKQLSVYNIYIYIYIYGGVEKVYIECIEYRNTQTLQQEREKRKETHKCGQK